MPVKLELLLFCVALAACGSHTTTSQTNTLRFSGQPSNGTCGTSLAPVTVQIVDGSNTVVADSNATVTLDLTANPNNATLCAAESVQAVNGVATFDTVCTHTAGQNYRLEASSTGLEHVTSATFDVALATEGESCSAQSDCAGYDPAGSCAGLVCADNVCVAPECPNPN